MDLAIPPPVTFMHFDVIGFIIVPRGQPDDRASLICSSVTLGTALLRLPDVRLPDVRLPDVRLPDVRLPDVRLPDVRLPDVPLDLRDVAKSFLPIGPSLLTHLLVAGLRI